MKANREYFVNNVKSIEQTHYMEENLKSIKKRKTCCCLPTCTCPYARSARTKKRNSKKRVKSKQTKRKRFAKSGKWLVDMSTRPLRDLLFSQPYLITILPARMLTEYNKQIERAMKSSYSQSSLRLIHQLQPKPAKNRLSEEAKERQRQWIEKNSRPKYKIKTKRKRRKVIKYRPLTERILEIAKPVLPRKKFVMKSWMRFDQPLTKIRPSAKTVVLSERMLQLTELMERYKSKKFDYDYSWKSSVSPNALNYKISDRLRAIALPKKYPKPSEMNVTENGVSKKALTYQISERIAQIAGAKKPYEARMDDDASVIIEQREYTAYGVVESALQYKTSDKIIEMATPRVKHQPPPPTDDKKRTKFDVVESTLSYKPTERILILAKPSKKVLKQH